MKINLPIYNYNILKDYLEKINENKKVKNTFTKIIQANIQPIDDENNKKISELFVLKEKKMFDYAIKKEELISKIENKRNKALDKEINEIKLFKETVEQLVNKKYDIEENVENIDVIEKLKELDGVVDDLRNKIGDIYDCLDRIDEILDEKNIIGGDKIEENDNYKVSAFLKKYDYEKKN